MFSVFEYMMSQGSKTQVKYRPTHTIYNERIKCFNKLIEIQKNIQSVDEQFINDSFIKGEAHKNALSDIEAYKRKYKKEYELCEKIMKY